MVIFSFSDDGRGSVSGEPTGDPSRPRRKVGETEKCRIVVDLILYVPSTIFQL